MLFDLRGRHRRRAVRVIYTGLAVLIGLGLVGFGIGGGFGGGGLFNAATEREGSGGASFSGEIKKYEKLTQTQPNNVAAWEKLVSAQLHEAGGEGYVTNGVVNAKGKALFARTAKSWEGYIALNPPKPSVTLAKEMLRLYGAEGLNQPASAVQVLQLIVSAEPTNASYYAFLAEYAYKAKNTRVGDLASAKAVALAPATQRARVKTELESVKKNPEGGETLTTTTNGKTYTGKAGSGGSFTGTVSTPTTPAGTGTSTTKK